MVVSKHTYSFPVFFFVFNPSLIIHLRFCNKKGMLRILIETGIRFKLEVLDLLLLLNPLIFLQLLTVDELCEVALFSWSVRLLLFTNVFVGFSISCKE